MAPNTRPPSSRNSLKPGTLNTRPQALVSVNLLSNGAAEAAVKSAKRVLRKNHEDPYIGLLNLRNTPTEGLKTSPAQRLMGRRTCTLLPMSAAALKPERQPDEKPTMEAKKLKTAEYHLHTHVLKPLDVGDQVRVQPLRPNEKAWCLRRWMPEATKLWLTMERSCAEQGNTCARQL